MTYSYTKHGPFVNGSAPGIDQTFLNDVEGTLLALSSLATDSNISSNNGIIAAKGLSLTPLAVSVSGTVSGFCTAVMTLQGTIKHVSIWLQNYKSASSQTIKLPIAFTGTSYWRITELQGGKLEALASGTAQTFSIHVTSAVGGGTQSSQAFINSWSDGLCRGAFDTVRITVTGTTPASSYVYIEGT